MQTASFAPDKTLYIRFWFQRKIRGLVLRHLLRPCSVKIVFLLAFHSTSHAKIAAKV